MIAATKREEMITKLQNLMRKTTANGATESEAQNALLMAQKLMLRHGIEENELDQREMIHGDANVLRKNDVYQKPVTNFITLNWWYKRLARVIAKNFRCYCWYEYNSGKGNGKRLMFVGLRDDTTIASDAFDFGVTSITHLSDSYLDERGVKNRTKRNALRNDYIQGYLDGLETKFEQQVKSNNFALALVKHELVIKEWELTIDKYGLKTAKPSQVSFNHDLHAMIAGYQDGINFNHGADKLGSGIDTTVEYDVEVKQWKNSTSVDDQIVDLYGSITKNVVDAELKSTKNRIHLGKEALKNEDLLTKQHQPFWSEDKKKLLIIGILEANEYYAVVMIKGG